MKELVFLSFVCLLLFHEQSSAISRIVNVSELQGELTQALRNQVQGLSYNDTLFINFDRIGCDTIKGTVTAHCSVVMNGLGRGLSTVILDNGSDHPGFQAFPDDTFFAMIGNSEHNIYVSITNMSFRLKDHTGIWWLSDNTQKHVVKIYHANSVNINHVESYLKNAGCTNFDLRVCSNVSVSDCKIVNINNCIYGGCLWLRGETHNVTINNNLFYKYGNDETIAFFSHLVDAYNGISGNISRSNINIFNNNFYYGYQGNDKNDLFNDMQFSLISGDTSPYSCTTTDFLFAHNNFFINDLTRRVISISFLPSDLFSNIYFNNNTFIDYYVGSIRRFYRSKINRYTQTQYFLKTTCSGMIILSSTFMGIMVHHIS